MRIATAFGIPIRLHTTFVLLLGFFALQALFASGWAGMASTLTLAVGLFGSVILHELGHALAARAYGIETRDITLYPFGGVASLESLPEDTRKELVIALAGPAVNGVLFVLALIAFALGGPEVFAILAGVNFVMGVFNLVPAFPMDGGRVLRALLSERMSFVAASRVASNLGWWFGIAFIGIGLATGTWSLALVGGFVLFAGQVEQRRLSALIRHGWRPPRPGGYPRFSWTRRWSLGGS